MIDKDKYEDAKKMVQDAEASKEQDQKRRKMKNGNKNLN